MKNILILLCPILLTPLSESSSKVFGIKEKQKRSGFINGDFIIGALFPVHEEPLLNGGTDPLMCGKIRERYGIQRVEAAFFAVESVNNDSTLLPNITLGINIKDGCSSESVSLHHSINFIEEPIPEQELPATRNIIGNLGKCRSKDEDDDVPLIGVIGPSTSTTSITVQNLLKLFHIPQIGYSATAHVLSNSIQHNFYLRVVPSDSFQVYVMFKLLNLYNWSYVSVFYSAGEYGQGGAAIIQQYAHEYEICVSKVIELSNSNDDWDYDNALSKLSEDKKARVVICFCEGSSIRKLLKAVKRNGLAGKYLFLGSDAWSSRYKLVEGYEEEAVGSLTIGIKTTPNKDFDDYYLQKNLDNNMRNPWFKEFWEYKFNCSLDSNSTQPQCTGKEDLREGHEQDSKVPYVIKSIYALAHGLHKMHADVCKNETLCDNFYPFNSTSYMEYLIKTNFSYKDEVVNFTSYGDPWHINYNIFNYQKLENGSYQYVNIGEYNGNDDELEDTNMDEDFFDLLKITGKIQFPGGKTTPIKSVCSDPCPPDQIRLSRSGALKCCWNCQACPPGSVPHTETTCRNCSLGSWPDKTRTTCNEVPVQYTQWFDAQSIVSLTISCIGIILTAITAFIFFKYRETPVVKSSTRELCYMMLVGMIMAHCITFSVIAKPSLISCIIRRIVPSVSFTMIYAALLVKTNRIARILAISKKKFPNLNPRFMSLQAQIIITSILIATQTIICIVLLIKEPSPPTTTYEVWENELYVNLICPMSNTTLTVPFSFVAIFIIMCTSYAVKTRNLPDNFNEAKFIGFAMYVTCITWIAFGLVYYGSELQVITICICASTNALVILVFLFFPKLYVIIWVPEKNTRANFTTSKGIRVIIGREDSSQNMNKGKLVETNFDDIPELSSRSKTSVTKE